MMSSTADDEFPPNPFRSGGDPQQGQQQQQMQQSQPQFATPPPLPPQQPPQQEQRPPQQMQLNDFYGETPQQGQWMQPQPDSFVTEQQQQHHQPGAMDNQMAPREAPPPQQQQQEPPRTRWQRCMACCSLQTYAAYFDVDTVDIKNRVKESVFSFYIPDKFRTEVVGVERNDTTKGADLYGPFWITMTLVFFLAVTSNLHAYLHSTTDEQFEYDITHLSVAMTVLFTFVFAVPSLLWLMTQCMGMATTMGLFDWICLYGYSMVIYLPASVLCLIPAELLEWLFLALATAVSLLLILRNIAAPLLSADTSQSKAGPIMLCVIACHVILLLILKLYFYHHHASTSSDSGSSSSSGGGGSTSGGGGGDATKDTDDAAANDDGNVDNNGGY